MATSNLLPMSNGQGEGGRRSPSQQWDVVDLYSGAGGASLGFHVHPRFRIVGAADAQMGKPSTLPGRLGCNSTYKLNIGIEPLDADLGTLDQADLHNALGLTRSPSVLIACPPCTGFSRTLAHNHLRDDPRNSLVARTALFAREFEPHIMIMENARELYMGRFARHLSQLASDMTRMGYRVQSGTYLLNEFGLPQKRERALVIAVRGDFPLLNIADLWEGISVDQKATHVRRAIWTLPPIQAGERHPDDPMHAAPRFTSKTSLQRLSAIPHDGGSWFNLLGHPEEETLLTPTMKHRAVIRDFGSHPDVYGRLWWDRPAATIKRECGHAGNGRYSHPEQDRLCSVREMAILNGFPMTYQFGGESLSNMYRHIGDAVPPLISYQLAALCSWILTGQRPKPDEMVLPGTHLAAGDIVAEAPEALPFEP